MFNAERLGLGGDGFLHGDNVHTHACATGRDHLGQTLQGETGHTLEEIADLRVLRHNLVVHVEQLRRTGDKEGKDIALVFTGVLLTLPAVFQQTDGGHLLEQFLQMLLILAGTLHKLPKGGGRALLHGEGDLYHLVGEDVCHAPEFRAVLRHGLQAELIGDPVGHLFAELEKILFVRNHSFSLQDSIFVYFSLVKDITGNRKCHAFL